MNRDIFVGWLARAVTRVMLRSVEVDGRERIPAGVPILVIANHENNLVDPMLLLGFTGLSPRFLAKHTLFTHPLVRHLVRLVRALPVYRREDGGDGRLNEATLDASARALGAGDTVGIFPEGGCHNEASRRPLKTGAARLAISAARLSEGHRVAVLPVGLVYTEKSRFRSSAAVIIGRPIWVGGDEQAHVLTSALAEALSNVTLNAASWEHWKQALRSAERRAGTRACAPKPVERFRRHSEAAGLVGVPSPVDRASAPDVPSWDHLPEASPSLARALVLTPFALAGLSIAGLPLAVALLTSGGRGRTPDVPATRRLMALLLFFPLVLGAELLALSWFLGPAASALAMVSAPLALLAVLDCRDAWWDIWRGLRMI